MRCCCRIGPPVELLASGCIIFRWQALARKRRLTRGLLFRAGLGGAAMARPVKRMAAVKNFILRGAVATKWVYVVIWKETLGFLLSRFDAFIC